MKTLVVAATYLEIKLLLDHFVLPQQQFVAHEAFDVLITGVGMTATAFALGQFLSKDYSLILNLGIAGSFDTTIPLGTVVNVTDDTFAELGADAPGHFITIDELGFGSANFKGITVPDLIKAKGITVNTVHGNLSGIAAITARLNPQIESMEGAAVLYCAQNFGIDCLQVRSISNFVTPRDRESWEIGLALKRLNEWAINYLTLITVS